MGERIAGDGVVRDGRSAVDGSALTGESVPVEAGLGEDVFADAFNGTEVPPPDEHATNLQRIGGGISS